MRSLIVLLLACFLGSAGAEARTFVYRASDAAKLVSDATAPVLRASATHSSAARVSFVHDEENFPNDLCLDAHVSQFEVQEGIRAIPVNADYCERGAGAMPTEVVAILARIRDLHVRTARTLGRDVNVLFGTGVRLSLGEHPLGPLNSFTDGSPAKIEIDVFPDFRADRFPERIYAHELTHWLLVENRLGDSALSIEGDYLFHESFADLVASYVTNSLTIGFSDPSIRTALTFARKGAPTQSMRRPFSAFYLGRFQTDPENVCAAIPSRKMTANERALCTFVRTDERRNAEHASLFANAVEKAPTAKELAASFRPERCLIHYRNGTAGLNACFMNAFGPVLISFIRTIDPLLGDQPVATMLDAIDRVGETLEHYTCAFTDPAATGTWAAEPASVSFLGFMRVFERLRSDLDARARAKFDAAWAKHGLDTWAKLERYDRETVIAAFAYQMLVAENRGFAETYDCASGSPKERGSRCAAKCAYVKPAPSSTTKP